MIRILLRALGLTLSLATLAVIAISPSPGGGPSPLERVPALMEMLEAKSRELEAARAAGPAAGSELASGRTATPPDAAPRGSMPAGVRHLASPATGPGQPPPRAAVRVHGGAPTGSGTVKVNRGLP